MAFSNLLYLDQFLRSAEGFDSAVRHFCLVAPLPVVLGRLAGRGGDPAHPATAWQMRRAQECCEAHRAREFSEHVPAEHLTPAQVAAEIVQRLS
jgi:hypothetical protein